MLGKLVDEVDQSESSSNLVERQFWELEVMGSRPIFLRKCLAQLVRASLLQREGRGFKSLSI